VETPYFLVALPQLNDPAFARTVVLVTHHGDEGANGLVINVPLVNEEDSQTQMVAEVKDTDGETLSEYEEFLFEGGPVNEETLFAIHDIEALADGDTPITNEVFLASNPDAFHRLLESEDFKNRRRFFVGCATWEAGQLDSELRTGAWFTVPFKKEYLFKKIEEDTDQKKWQDDLWVQILREGGGDPFTMMGQGPVDSGYN